MTAVIIVPAGILRRVQRTTQISTCKHILAVFNSVPRNEVEQVMYLERRKTKVDERFIVTIDGKEFVLYNGLLDIAHQKNLFSDGG